MIDFSDEFHEVARWYQRRGIWTNDNTVQFSLAIEAALECNDTDVLTIWHDWIRGEVEFIRRLRVSARARMHALEDSIRSAKAGAA